MRHDPDREVRFVGTLLTWLAAFQGVFFLLPLAEPRARLIGVGLGLCALLAARLLRRSPGKRAGWALGIALAISVHFVMHLVNALAYPARLWQLAILFSYAATWLALLTAVTGVVDFRRAANGWGTIGAAMLVLEAVVGGSTTAVVGTARMFWAGAGVTDSFAVPRLTPNAVLSSRYPDNPRGYFEEPDAVERLWSLGTYEGSKAELRYPPGRPGTIRVQIDSAPGKVRWHIALAQSPIRVLAGERYRLRFRARADSSRVVYASLGQAHPPFGPLGLWREVRLDTTWQEFASTFRVTDSDRDARILLEFGEERPSVELADLSMREVVTNRPIQADGRREIAVTYHLDSLGCRGDSAASAAAPSLRPQPVPWRIVLMGGGDSFGVGVRDGDTFASRLQAQLDEPAARRVNARGFEVINCSVPGASTQAERARLDSLAGRITPNVVLLAVSPDDDHVSLDEGRPPVARDVSRMQRLFHVWAALSALREPEPPAPDYGAIVAGVKQMDAEAADRGIRLAVVLFQHRRTRDWEGLDSALTSGLAGTRVPVVNLGPTLLAFGEQKLLVDAETDWHPNELAHRMAADALRKFLLDGALLGEERGKGGSAKDSAGVRR